MKPKMISLLKVVPVYKFGEKYETSVDDIYIFEVNKNISSDKFDVFEYSGKPKPKPSLIDNSHKIYQRDKKVAENALERVHIKRASKIIANMITERKIESSLS